MNELITTQPPALTGVNPLQWIDYMGPVIAGSRMFGCDNDDQGRVLASMQVTQGLPLMDILRTYYFIEGKLSMKSEAMLAIFRNKYQGQHQVLRRDPEGAAAKFTDRHGLVTQTSLQWQQLKGEPFVLAKSGKLKDNYATPHKRMQMIWARLVSDSMRVIEPGVVAGVYTPEEISDFEQFQGQPIDVEFSVEPQTVPLQPVSQADLSARDTDPASPAQIDELRNLMQQVIDGQPGVCPGDPGVVQRVQAAIQRDYGKQKLAQLSCREAAQIRAKLMNRLAESRF